MTNIILDEPNIKGNKFDRNPWAVQLLILLVFLIAGQIAGSIPFLLYYGLKITDLHALLSQAKELNSFRFLQMLSTIAGFAVPAWLFSKLKTGSWTAYSMIQNKFPAFLLLLVPFIVITAYPLINISYIINQHTFLANWMQSSHKEYEFLTEALLGGTALSTLAINLVAIAILPAIAEEWFFRGSLQRMFQQKMNAHLAILLTALLFSLIHMDFPAFLPRVLLGLLLGYIYYYSGSLWVSIWAHLFNNGMEVVLHFLKNTGKISGAIDEPGMPDIGTFLGCTAVLCLVAYAFYFISRKKFDTLAG